MEPSYRVRRADDRVAVSGDIDLGSSLGFAEDLHAAIAENASETLELDLSRVTFIDSAGLQVLISAVQSVHRPVHIGASPRVYVALDVVGLTKGQWDGVTVRRVDD